jgi:hypothetical protein
MKRVILAYRIIENQNRVEYWTKVTDWKESLFFETMVKLNKDMPCFISVTKKEYRQLKKTPGGFIKKYNDFMKEQMEKLKNEK